MNRMIIFSLVDNGGYADDYVLHLLQSLRTYAKRMILVCNRELHPQTSERVATAVDEIIINGDPAAHNYAAALSQSDTAVEDADEIVLMSSIFFGPFYPLSEMFSEMEGRQLDFWTLTPHSFADRYPYPYTSVPDISEQSHMAFFAFRKTPAMSKDLSAFWAALPSPGALSAAAAAGTEIIDDIPGYFVQKGYRSGYYIEPASVDDLNPFHLLYEPKLLFEKYRCPIFDIRVFTVPRERIVENTLGETTPLFLAALEEQSAYDTRFIWRYLIRAAHPCDFVNALGLLYVLPENRRASYGAWDHVQGVRVCLCMHLYYMDLIDDSFAYAKNAPDDMDIFITTTDERKKQTIEAVFLGLPNKVEVRLTENRGRNESALLIGLADVAKEYDFICYYHDKKTDFIKPNSIGRSNAYKLQVCTMPDTTYSKLVIDLFINNPAIGMLVPPEPNHAYYSTTIGNEWGRNYGNTKALYDKLGLTAPIRQDKYPVASYGSIFWFRCAALRRLFEENWRYEDFPEEPVDADESLLHAIERIYPYVCQSAGYIPAYIMSDRAATYEILNLKIYVRAFNELAEKNGQRGPMGAMISHFEYALRQGGEAVRILKTMDRISPLDYLRKKVLHRLKKG